MGHLSEKTNMNNLSWSILKYSIIVLVLSYFNSVLYFETVYEQDILFFSHILHIIIVGFFFGFFYKTFLNFKHSDFIVHTYL